MDTYTKYKAIRAVSRTHACADCGKKPMVGQFMHAFTQTTFAEGAVYTYRYTRCAKCEYKLQAKMVRKENRMDLARRGECPMMVKQMCSWSDGSLTGGECQMQCHECDLHCTFGAVGSF